jgi:hypothetical protein
MRCTIAGVLFVLVALMPSRVGAQQAELTGFAGYRFGSDLSDPLTNRDFGLEESSSYGLIFDYRLSDNGQIEFLFSRQQSEVEDRPDLFLFEGPLTLDIDYYHVGGLYQWGDKGDLVRPFLVGTLGATYLSPDLPDLDDEIRFSMGFGGGFKIMPSKRVGLRLEGRGFSTFIDASGGIFCGSGGCAVFSSSDIWWQFEWRAGLTLAF